MDISDIMVKVKHHKPSILGLESYRKFAVLIPLIEKNQETHLLFEVRSLAMRSQPGDVCFPGGKVDQDDTDERECALRETSEELGIDQAGIAGGYPLDYLVGDGRIIYPFIGRIPEPELVNPNPAEVEAVFTVPLAFFQQTRPDIYKVALQPVPENDFPFELIQGGKDYNWRPHIVEELFFQYDDYVIWGLTARIITHFVELLEAVAQN